MESLFQRISGYFKEGYVTGKHRRITLFPDDVRIAFLLFPLYKLIPLMFRVGIFDFFTSLDFTGGLCVLLVLGFSLVCVGGVISNLTWILDVCLGEYECMEAVITKRVDKTRYGRHGIIGTFYSYEVRTKNGKKYSLGAVRLLAESKGNTVYVLRAKGCIIEASICTENNIFVIYKKN